MENPNRIAGAEIAFNTLRAGLKSGVLRKRPKGIATSFQTLPVQCARTAPADSARMMVTPPDRVPPIRCALANSWQ
ncbi:hypothetical protein G3N57_12795 [Paraburkholderia sp. Se-20369]|nr:hypothetical protein [Paraburkholderia sp. Se-20369]